mmetsp:Transcript_8810/g.28982  ORF Transcript_8810/g.28982 Transcript_8810/m.28982 type:complete len:220 (+) Transcript_8810:63-722(+)
MRWWWVVDEGTKKNIVVKVCVQDYRMHECQDLDLVEGLEEVCFNVGIIFNPASEADEVVLDPELGPYLRSLVPVRDDGRLLNEGLDAAERRGDVRELAAVDKFGGGPEVSVNLERHDAAEALHLLDGDFVVLVALEPGVVHRLNLGVRLEHLGDGERVGVVALHTQRERLHAAEKEVGGVRVDNAAEHVVELPHLAHQLRAARQRARQHVVVAGEVLGG